jgi:hypothetical protein
MWSGISLIEINLNSFEDKERCDIEELLTI